MWPALLTYFVVGFVVVSDAATVKEPGEEDVCKSEEGFCMNSRCLPKPDVKSFTCKCDKAQYFNASAQRCYHLHSCLHTVCRYSRCHDEDGYGEANCDDGTGIDTQEIRSRESRCEDSGGMVEHISGEAAFRCICPEEAELINGSCLNCTQEQKKKCAKEGRLCIILNAEPHCKCPDNSLEHEAKCSDQCTPEKNRECSTALSQCVVKDGKETCWCLPPLQWNSTSGHCEPATEYKYIAEFKEHLEESEQYGTLGHCNDPAWLSRVSEAMKSLYGKSLVDSRVIKCGEYTKEILTFSEEPSQHLLRRILLCETRLGDVACHFPPGLRVVAGSISGPLPVNICSHYFQYVHNITNGSYYCTAEERGRYTLRCTGGKVTRTIARGALEIQYCQGARPNESGASALTIALGITAGAVFLIALGLLVLGCKKTYYYRVSPDEEPCDIVKLQSQPDSLQPSENLGAASDINVPGEQGGNDEPQQGEQVGAVPATTCDRAV